MGISDVIVVVILCVLLYALTRLICKYLLYRHEALNAKIEATL